MRITFLIRMSTHDAQEDALGGREAGELQADGPAGESPRQGLQVPGEAAESARFQQTEHGTGDVGGRASREQPRESHLNTAAEGTPRRRREQRHGERSRRNHPPTRRDRTIGVNCAAVRILDIRACRAPPSRPELRRRYARVMTSLCRLSNVQPLNITCIQIILYKYKRSVKERNESESNCTE